MKYTLVNKKTGQRIGNYYSLQGAELGLSNLPISIRKMFEVVAY